MLWIAALCSQWRFESRHIAKGSSPRAFYFCAVYTGAVMAQCF